MQGAVTGTAVLESECCMPVSLHCMVQLCIVLLFILILCWFAQPSRDGPWTYACNCQDTEFGEGGEGGIAAVPLGTDRLVTELGVQKPVP